MPRTLFTLLLLCLLAPASVAAQRSGVANPAHEYNIRQTIQTFYAWYFTHHKEASAFPEFMGHAGLKAVTGVNWDEVRKLHDYLRKNAPGLGEAYFQNDLEFLREKDSLFHAHPDEDMGFDYDRFTQSQDDLSYLRRQLAARNRWDITINNDTAYVTAYGRKGSPIPDFAFSWEMRKESGLWKIARIQGDVECRQ